jgi:hypothetical protein
MNCITGWAWGVYDEERANIELDGYRDPLSIRGRWLCCCIDCNCGEAYFMCIIAGKQNLRQKTSL